MSIFKHLKLKVNLKKTFCPKCNEEQPKIRKPKGWQEILWGGNTCKKCGCKMDRFGNEREK